MDKPLTAHVVSSHDPEPPKLPPLPEAILIYSDRDWDSWEVEEIGTLKDCQKFVGALPNYATRILAITQPTPPREPTDAEVCAIVREGTLNVFSKATDAEILSEYSIAATCVRAALRKAGGK